MVVKILKAVFGFLLNGQSTHDLPVKIFVVSNVTRQSKGNIIGKENN